MCGVESFFPNYGCLSREGIGGKDLASGFRFVLRTIVLANDALRELGFLLLI